MAGYSQSSSGSACRTVGEHYGEAQGKLNVQKVKASSIRLDDTIFNILCITSLYEHDYRFESYDLTSQSIPQDDVSVYHPGIPFPFPSGKGLTRLYRGSG